MPATGGVIPSRESTPGQLDDRDASIHPGRVASIAREGGEHPVSQLPESVALALVVHDRRPFPAASDATAGWLWLPVTYAFTWNWVLVVWGSTAGAGWRDIVRSDLHSRRGRLERGRVHGLQVRGSDGHRW